MSALREAPPVSVVCHGRGWRIAQALLHAAAAASILTWGLQRAAVFDTPTLAMTAAFGASYVGVLAWHLLRRQPVTLRWDGQQWTLDAEPITPTVMLDVSGLLLLRGNRSQGRAHWLATSRGDAGASWHALRVAVYARPRAVA